MGQRFIRLVEVNMNRREFFKNVCAVPVVTAMAIGIGDVEAQSPFKRVEGSRLKLSCNLFSFNEPLSSGAMTLEQVFEFCARAGFDAIDPTAYYFPGYPQVPTNDYLVAIKRKAFLLGLDISGTGVRNDFTDPDDAHLKADINLVTQWIECAAHLGAPVLRVFSGKGVPVGFTRDQVQERLVTALKACAQHGARFGVMVALQNHADFIQNADQLIQILQLVNSEWLGVNLDIGSFQTADPYEDIARCAPFAVTWQIKEKVSVAGHEQKTDLKKILKILHECGYRGYIPLETLGEGDPRIKVLKFLDEVQSALHG
jgi:sugar phosphate isomerase/epimerase